MKNVIQLNYHNINLQELIIFMSSFKNKVRNSIMNSIMVSNEFN